MTATQTTLNFRIRMTFWVLGSVSASYKPGLLDWMPLITPFPILRWEAIFSMGITRPLSTDIGARSMLCCSA